MPYTSSAIKVIKNKWEVGKSDELAWWREYLVTKGLQWPEDYRNRLNSQEPLQDYVIQCLDAAEATVALLDVGAGPMTFLGKRWQGRTVHITAVDPLASQYDQLLTEFGIAPSIRTQPGESEHLLDCFPPNYFDLVHMRNALDHSYDPVLGLQQMLGVVKAGCYVLLAHHVNEGEKGNYAGLHQWNLCVDNNNLVIWNSHTQVCVNDALGDSAQVTASVDGDWVWVRLRKRTLQ